MYQPRSRTVIWINNRSISSIALFTVSFCHLRYNVIQRGCKAISGENYRRAQNFFTYMLDLIVMQMSRVNCKKGYCTMNVVCFTQPLIKCLVTTLLFPDALSFLFLTSTVWFNATSSGSRERKFAGCEETGNEWSWSQQTKPGKTLSVLFYVTLGYQIQYFRLTGWK